MRFNIIDAAKKTSTIIKRESFPLAVKAAGLSINEIDHGTVASGVGIVVYEFGLFTPPREQHYFSIGKRLFAGNAVLYSYDDQGETTDFGPVPIIPHYYDSYDAVERAIKKGYINRPQMAINNEVIWSWPEQR